MVKMLEGIVLRELGAVRRSVEAYPDDASLWKAPSGLPNTGGTLALHIAGNLQHYFGAVLGKSTYVRNRDAEFARRDVSRAEILNEVDAASAAVELGLRELTEDSLQAPFPVEVGGRRVATADYIVHLLSHLAYHLGQLDYHRRMVCGDTKGVNAISMAELAEVTQ
jgi:uncharacterized damage-inducible protein DinB